MKLLKKIYNSSQCHCFPKKYAWLLVVFICAVQYSFGQDFTVQAAPTHATCPGNGMLLLSVENADPNVPVNYKVYLLPNTTTAIFNSSGTTVNGLNNGTYLVVATQVIGGTPVQDDIEVIIENQTTPLVFDFEHVNAMCGADGSITVNVTSGNVVSYEIIAGPITRTPQPENTFPNLYTGTYSVRVTDNCGTAIVVTHNVPSDASVLVVSPPMFPDLELPGCDLITAAHDISPTEEWMVPQVPINVTYTVYPPGGGAPLVYTQTINALMDGPDVFQVVPFYYDTPYYYDLEVVDACGTVYTTEDNLVHQRFVVIGGYGDAGCPGKFLQISLNKFVAPYTITFTEWPDEFSPETLNPQHPGPFSAPVTEYGSEPDEIAVPYGNYSFTVTDACGRTCVINDLLLEEQEVEPSVATFPATCLNGMGGVEINITGFEMVSAVITVAPPEYPEPLEDDVSEHITPEFKLKMLQLLPPGDYVAVVTDECGREYTEPFTINVSNFPSISGNVRVDCTTGMGTARIGSSTPVTKVIITQAPAAFTAINPVPHNANYNLNATGEWFMNNLPPGTYKFQVDDECSTNFELTKIITGYTTTADELTITRHCGSFDLLLEHTTTSSIFLFYGIQKEYGPDIWGHPLTGVLYDGAPNENNAYEIESGVEIFTLPFTGKFRIIKRFEAFGTGRTDDGVPDKLNCIEVLHHFDFTDDLTFDSIQNLTCSGNVADVQVFFIGAEPITYKIVEKNGQPFVVDNGTNNIFLGLEPAQYTIEAEDPCGNQTPYTFSVADLPSLVTATPPGDISLCDETSDNAETFDLNAQTPLVLDGQDPANCSVSYHTSEADADAGINALPLNYTSGTATIYARVLNSLNPNCDAITSFDIIVMPVPVLYMPGTYSICEGESVTVYGDPGYNVYKWDGVTGGPFKTFTTAGTYTLTVENQYGCEGSKTFTVTSSSAPAIASIDIADWDNADNTITVITQESDSTQYFEYSLDGTNYQASNVFTGLAPGPYTVYVRDIYDCGSDEGEVYLLTYPKFFTPNGDGINDLWRIQFSSMEPDMLIYIYDRYGKVVSSFDAMGTGWDGTFNGKRLPATDYWFVVKRQDGKEYKGHFSMMR